MKLKKGPELEADLRRAELRAGSLGLLPAKPTVAQQSSQAPASGIAPQQPMSPAPMCGSFGSRGSKAGTAELGIFAVYPFSLVLSPLTFYTTRERRLPTLLMPNGIFLHEQTPGYTVWNMFYVYRVHIMPFSTISLLRKYIPGVIAWLVRLRIT